MTADSETKVYKIGNRGPAGGWIFYDRGYYHDGWRYLEAAPEDINVDGQEMFVFGYWRTAPDMKNGTVGTGSAMGMGKRNTFNLVKKMGAAAYSSETGSDRTWNYAARLCIDYTYRGYEDWFLPSLDEMYIMRKNLGRKKYGLHRESTYWSSTENPGYVKLAWVQYFFDGGQSGIIDRSSTYRVRAARSF